MMQKASSMGETVEQLQRQLEQTWQALQASEARFHNIIEKNADGIIIVDQDGIVRFVNGAAEALLGRSADNLVGEMFGFPLVADDTTVLDIVCPRGKKTVAEVRVVESEWEGEFVYLASLRDITYDVTGFLAPTRRVGARKPYLRNSVILYLSA